MTPRQGGVEAPGVGGGTAGDGGPGDPRHLPAGPGGGQEPQAAGQESSALWAWIVVFSKSVVLSLTRKFLLCNIPGFFPAAGQFNQILDCCTGCGDMANLTVSALS